MNFSGKKTVVVTGASSGIGRSCVERMIQAGWHVFATVRKSQDLDRLQSEGSSDLTPLILDVTDSLTITRAAEKVAAELGESGLDGLVNVAGIGIVGPIEYATRENLQRIFEVNVFGQIAVTQAFLPWLRRARGRVVNISSVGAHIAIPFGGLLSASKSAFGILSDSLRLELRPFGVRVVTVEPGSISTPAVDKTLGDIDAVVRNLPASGKAEYGEQLRKFIQMAYRREKNSDSPDVVAKSVHHALTARRPRIRYRVGKDARVLVTLPRILSDRLLDQVRLRIFGLPTQFGALQSP
jgi:NAD(P)-dependent dehydrogenase (short-subunit alcohol dehydrogenase family)